MMKDSEIREVSDMEKHTLETDAKIEYLAELLVDCFLDYKLKTIQFSKIREAVKTQ